MEKEAVVILQFEGELCSNPQRISEIAYRTYVGRNGRLIAHLDYDKFRDWISIVENQNWMAEMSKKLLLEASFDIAVMFDTKIASKSASIPKDIIKLADMNGMSVVVSIYNAGD